MIQPFYVLLLSLTICATALPQDKLNDDTPIARIGNSTITRGEFVLRYESNPGPQRQIEARKEINKEVFLFSMIAEKLLAGEAMRQGLEADSNYQRAVKEVEDPLVRDELYREEVRQKIENSPREIEDAISKSQVQLNVYMVSASTESGAKFLESRIREGIKLEDFSFVRDTSGEFKGPDSMIVHWGDDNQEIEDAAYKLKLGETSSPVEFGDGWYILKLMGESFTSSGGAEEQMNLKKRAREILTRRKEAVRMVEYLGSALKDKKAQANGKLFSDLSESMFKIFLSQQSDDHAGDNFKFILNEAVFDSLNDMLSNEWNDPFIVFSDSRWTLGETVEKLFGQGFGVADPALLKIRVTLDQALRNLIYQEELTRIGYDENLEMTPRVQKKLSMWRDFYLANLIKEKISDTLKVTDSDVAYYMTTMLRESAHSEMVKLKEMIIPDAGTAARVSDLLSKGEPFEKIAQAFAVGGELGNRVRNGYFTVSELGGFGTLLKDVPVGRWVGPVLVRNEYVFAELLGREDLSPSTKDPAVDLNLSMRQKLVADTLKYLTDKYVARLAEDIGVDIYANRLAETHVTSLPMLMFQLLGFGGRMFACPIIAPEASWVQYWDAAKHLIP